MYSYGYSYGYGLIGGNTYNPLINYDWSTTTAQEYKTDGVELVDGDIDRWNLIPNSTIENSTIVLNTADGYIGTIFTPFIDEEPYILSFNCKDYISGSFYIGVGDKFGNQGGTSGSISDNGIYSFPVKGGDAGKLYISCSSALCKIDNLSVQKVIQEPNKRYLKDVGSTPTYDASMYFGRGAYLNGVDQTITVPINTTIQTALKRVNGVVTINETSQTLTNYVISGLGVHKDYYLFTRLLTTAEKDSYTNTPELFYAMAQADSTCVLNMPMCETSSTVRNYKTGIDYAITNYTTSVRDNAKNLRYGLQTCKFVRDSLGVIQSASDYLECDGSGYADTGWIPSASEDWTLEFKANEPTSDLRRHVFGNDKVNLRIDTNSNVVLTLTPDYYIAYKTSFDLNNNKYVIRYQASSLTADFFRSGLKIDTLVGLSISSLKSVYLGRYTEYSPPYSDSHNKIIEIFKVHPKALTNEEIQAL